MLVANSGEVSFVLNKNYGNNAITSAPWRSLGSGSLAPPTNFVIARTMAAVTSQSSNFEGKAIRKFSVRICQHSNSTHPIAKKKIVSMIPASIVKQYTVPPTNLHRCPNQTHRSRSDSLSREMCHFRLIGAVPVTPDTRSGRHIDVPKAVKASPKCTSCDSDALSNPGLNMTNRMLLTYPRESAFRLVSLAPTISKDVEIKKVNAKGETIENVANTVNMNKSVLELESSVWCPSLLLKRVKSSDHPQTELKIRRLSRSPGKTTKRSRKPTGATEPLTSKKDCKTGGRKEMPKSNRRTSNRTTPPVTRSSLRQKAENVQEPPQDLNSQNFKVIRNILIRGWIEN